MNAGKIPVVSKFLLLSSGQNIYSANIILREKEHEKIHVYETIYMDLSRAFIPSS